MQDVVAAPESRVVYEIPAENLFIFQDKIAKISKKAVKLVGAPIVVDVIESFLKEYQVNGRKNEILCYRVAVDAPVDGIKLAGWTLAARVDHSNEAGNILRTIPKFEGSLPEIYRTRKAFCDHCNSWRSRRDTFIVCNDASQEFKQIGGNCLKDFLGHDAHRLTAVMTWIRDIDAAADEEQDFCRGGGDRRTLDLVGFLGHVAWAIRKYGWVAATAARENESLTPTRTRATINMFPPRDRHGNFSPAPEPVTDEDRALVEASLDWAKGISPNNEYQHNILVLSQARYIEERSAGIAASIVSSYMKHVQRLEARKQSEKTEITNEFTGTIGDRRSFGQVRVLSVFNRPTEDGFPCYMYRFVTAEGHVLFWRASKSQYVKQGEVVTLKGTVKDHREWEGKKSTTITRCVVEKVEDTKKAA